MAEEKSTITDKETAQQERRNFVRLSALGAAAALLITSEGKAQTTPQQGVGLTPAAPTPLPALPEKIDPAKIPGLSAMIKAKSETFARSGGDKQAWEKIKSAIDSNMRVTADGSAAGSLSPFSRAIESGFVFKAEPLDANFSPLHVEPLIDQAADLLDRGLRDRATWDEQAIKMLELSLELGEYKDLDAIHAEEEQAGLYDVPSRLSAAEKSAEALNASYQQYNEDLIDRIIQDLYSTDEINKSYNASRKAAWLTGLVPARYDGQTLVEWKKYNYGGVEKEMATWAIDAAEALSAHQLFTESRSWRLQKEIFDTLTEVSKRKLPGLNSKAEWDDLNANFMRRRTLIARKYQDIKSRAAVDPDGILNYQKRLAPLRKRFHEDFRHALARLKVISQGMRDLYKYNVPLPTDEGSVDYFDRCLIWTRSAIQWLIRFSRVDQSVVVPVSMRDILGEDLYRQEREIGKWTLPLDANVFGGMVQLRVRGLSAFVVGESAEDKLWQLTVSVPPLGTVLYLSGDPIKIDQSRIPPCRFARVTKRESLREPDLVGVSSLYNASPVGLWEVQVNSSIPKEKLDKLKDIHLDIHLAYRSKSVV